MKILFVILLFFKSTYLFAFPELSRHGYFNCTTCHLSPTGGGALTQYGRELSKELLSNSSIKGEQYFAYNAIPSLSKNDRILVGAYIRGLQVLRDNNQAKEARTILMQADAEGAYNEKNWAFLATIGRQEIRNGLQSEGHLFSRRHYFLARLDKKQNIRLGKFQMSFGLSDPNHYMFVRKDLNFAYDTETYNLEYSFLSENWNFFGTFITNLKTDNYFRNSENGVSFNGSLKVFGKSKIGLSLYHGNDSLNNRTILGGWGIGAFTKNFFLMSELDFQNQNLKQVSATQNGYVMSHRLSYEIQKGIIPFISFDQKYLDLNNKNSELHSYGIGGRLFPRPHFEITGSIQREERVVNNLKDNLFWVMGQFYL